MKEKAIRFMGVERRSLFGVEGIGDRVLWVEGAIVVLFEGIGDRVWGL